MKLKKRPVLTVIWHPKEDPYGNGIYNVVLVFQHMREHKKGSTRPAGYLHSTSSGGDNSVKIRWLWTDDHRHFAPEISYAPTATCAKIVAKINKVMATKTWRCEMQPEELCEALGALIVESVRDEGEAYSDYRGVRIPGEPEMVTLARAAV